MLTRCPACDTTFRVTPEQLKARQGRVRCGACEHAFDAFDTLLDDVIIAAPHAAPPAEAPPPPQVEPAIAPPAEETAPIDASAVDLLAASTDSADYSAPDTASPAAFAELEVADVAAVTDPAPETDAWPPAPNLPAEPEPEPEHQDTAIAPAAEPVATETPETPPLVASPELPSFSSWEPLPPPPPRRWPWLLGGLLALCALGLQLIYQYRIEAAVLLPEARPLLQSACEAIGCSVGLPHKIDLVGIEASDLHPDPGHKGQLALTATLKNRAPFAQEYPHLELTLTDAADKAIARKVLAPADYLPPGAKVSAGMTANGDLALSVGIDASTLTASGYRLYVFYP